MTKKTTFNYAEFISEIKNSCSCFKTGTHNNCPQFSSSDETDYFFENDKEPPKECQRGILLHNYERTYGSQDNLNIEDTNFYQQYLSKFVFDGIRIKVPEGLKDDYDWDLLYKLISASLSSDYFIKRMKGLLHQLTFIVTSKDKKVTLTPKLEDCWSFQIRNQFVIYITEQMQFFLLLKSHEYAEILFQQNIRLDKHKQLIGQLRSRNDLEKILSK